MVYSLCKSFVQILLLAFPAITAAGGASNVTMFDEDFSVMDFFDQDFDVFSPFETFLKEQNVNADVLDLANSLQADLVESRTARMKPSLKASITRIEKAKHMKGIPADFFKSFDTKYKALVVDTIRMNIPPALIDGAGGKKQILKGVKKLSKEFSLAVKDDFPVVPITSRMNNCMVSMIVDIISIILTACFVNPTLADAAAKSTFLFLNEYQRGIIKLIVEFMQRGEPEIIYGITFIMNVIGKGVNWGAVVKHVHAQVGLSFMDIANLIVIGGIIFATDGEGMIGGIAVYQIATGWQVVNLIADVIMKC